MMPCAVFAVDEFRSKLRQMSKKWAALQVILDSLRYHEFVELTPGKIWAIGMAPRHQLDHDEDCIRVVLHIDHIKKNNANDWIVAFVVVFGKQGLSMEDEAADWSFGASINGGFFLRRNHVLPVFEFHREDYSYEEFDRIKDSLVEVLAKRVFDRAPQLPHNNLLQPRPNSTNNIAAATLNSPRVVQLKDVLCDRVDRRCRSHAGNKRFAILVCMSLTKDYDLKDVSVRVRIARSIIATVRSGNGRFLAKTTIGSWKAIDYTLAIKWISLVIKTADRKRDEIVGAEAAAADTNRRLDPKTIADSVKYSMYPNDNDDDEAVLPPSE